jgi:hypothetical protein
VVKLKKDFTQTILIKGSELEKMPFSNLSEAINVWLYGVYTNELSILYVVNDNPLSDVNMYSIHDIEEIVFVQNALVQVNGAIGQQQIVLVTTKKGGSGKSGITIAGQSSLVNRDVHDRNTDKAGPSNTNFYHQYYARAYLNTKKISFGVSANYLRDVLPSEISDSIHTGTPFNLNRLRLNGFIEIKPGSKNEIFLSVGYSPQKIDSAQTVSFYNAAFYGETHQRERIFTPFARWRSEFIPRLKNDLQAAWLNFKDKENSLIKYTSTQYSLTGGPFASTGEGNQLTNHLLIRDRIAYSILSGQWNLEPSLNASFEHIKYNFSEGVTNNIGTSFSSSQMSSAAKGNLYFLTPSFNLMYKNLFDFQGGVLANLSPHGQKNKRYFPFANLSFGILKMCKPESKSSLKIFGSYSGASYMTLQNYQLYDLTTGSRFSSSFLNPIAGFFSGGYPIVPSTAPAIPNFWIWEVGTRLSVLNNRLQINYNFERRYYQGEALTYAPYGTNNGIFYLVFPNYKSSTNFLGILAKAWDRKITQWKTGLNIASISTKANSSPYFVVQNGVGDFNNSNDPSWTGGWVNRFEYREFSAGLDLLYHFNDVIVNNRGIPGKTNSIVLQNIFAGWQFYLPKSKRIEIYLNGRNLLQSKKDNLIDGRRYFGIGAKLAI